MSPTNLLTATLLFLILVVGVGFVLLGAVAWLLGRFWHSPVVVASGRGLVAGAGGYLVLFFGSVISWTTLVGSPGDALDVIGIVSLAALPVVALACGLALAIRASDGEPIRRIRGRGRPVENR